MQKTFKTLVAIKSISKQILQDEKQSDLKRKVLREVNILKRIQHPSVV